ncbi:MAG: hypothetical protein JWL85_332 [Candidatus Saccharibacteria bacterium]|nr:hypothetical protein [Candidatus Saccharibacteria bacterium]
MQTLLAKLQPLVPNVSFAEGTSFFWSPKQKLITYRVAKIPNDRDVWALLHETAHASLNHTQYNSDFELLMLEVAAWEKACEIGTELGLPIDEEHIQNCLDTYRDWVHQRSTCPSCSSTSFQKDPHSYHCHNCQTVWQVSASRFCRPYRLRDTSSKAKALPAPTFM